MNEWFAKVVSDFQGAFIEGDRWKLYFQGLGKTLQIAAGAVILGIVIGIVIAIIKVSANQRSNSGKCPIVLKILEKICDIFKTIGHFPLFER